MAGWKEKKSFYWFRNELFLGCCFMTLHYRNQVCADNWESGKHHPRDNRETIVWPSSSAHIPEGRVASGFNQRLHTHLVLLFFFPGFPFLAQQVDFSSPSKSCLNWRPGNPEKQWCLLPSAGSLLLPAQSWLSKDTKGWKEPQAEVWGR